MEREYTLSTLQEAIGRGVESCHSIRFDRNNRLHQMAVDLKTSILETASSILILLSNDKTTDAKILLRSLLEYYVELKLLSKDRTHLWKIQLAFCTRMLQQLKQAEAGNPYAQGIKDKIDTSAEIASWTRKKEEVAKLGGKNLSIEDKFRSLGMTHDYEMLYRSLSQFAHGTFSGVISRSFEVDREKSDFEIVLYRKPDDVATTLATAVAVLDETAGICSAVLALTHPSSRPQ